MNVARMGIDTPHELLSMLEQTIGIILRSQTMILSHLLIQTHTFPPGWPKPVASRNANGVSTDNALHLFPKNKAC